MADAPTFESDPGVAAARQRWRVVENARRGTGRTSAQLAALPDGAFYLVHCQEMVRYCRDLLRKAGRRHDAIRFVTPSQWRSLEGVRVNRWDVDHFYFDGAGRDGPRLYDMISQAAAGAPYREARA
jgi:hypothetical protein